MTIRECYEAMEGNYEEVMARLLTEARVEKFMQKFPKDPSFENLHKALEAEKREEAFMAAHSIKGVSQNLGFTSLYESSQELTEALRPGRENISAENIQILFRKVEEDYQRTIQAIEQFCESLANMHS